MYISWVRMIGIQLHKSSYYWCRIFESLFYGKITFFFYWVFFSSRNFKLFMWFSFQGRKAVWNIKFLKTRGKIRTLFKMQKSIPFLSMHPTVFYWLLRKNVWEMESSMLKSFFFSLFFLPFFLDPKNTDF